MELILIRHAKTEAKRDDLDDRKRELTDKGKKKFEKILPKLAAKLADTPKSKRVMWTSPATRAKETADLVSTQVETNQTDVHEFIYSGDFSDLTEALESVDDDATLMVVGHEPRLSQWTKEMTGEDLKIKKGAILSFKLQSKQPLEAELQWHIKP